MKKKVLGALTAALVLIMGATTVFAANSPTAEDLTVNKMNSAVTSVKVDGKDVTVTNVSKEVYKEADTQKKKTDDSIIAMADVTVSGKSNVVLAVDGIRAGDKVYVMHLRTIGGTTEWEYVPATAGNGTVSFTLEDGSPVIVVKQPGTTGSNSGSSSSGGSYYPGGSSSSGSGSSSGSASTEDKDVSALNNALNLVTIQGQNTAVTTTKVSKADYQKANEKKQNANDQIVAMTDITGVSVTSGKVTVVLSVPGLQSTDKVYVMHLRKIGGVTEWEYLVPSNVGNGTVTVTMSSFSPVYVVKQNGSNSVNTGNQNPADSNDKYDEGYDKGFDEGYDNGYEDGYFNAQEPDSDASDKDSDKDSNKGSKDESGKDAATDSNKNSGTGSSGTTVVTTTTTVTAPKTGASLPALPFVAVFAAAGIAVCGKKARKSN